MPRTATKHRTPHRGPGRVESVGFHEPSPRQRMQYQLDDMAHTMTREHPRVKAIHAKIKGHLESLADRHMGTGKETSVYKEDDEKMAKGTATKAKAKVGTAHKSSAKKASAGKKNKVKAMGKKRSKMME